MKRKRHEICTAVPGTGVNIYEVRFENQTIISYLTDMAGTDRSHSDVPCGPTYGDVQRPAMFVAVEGTGCYVPTNMLRHR